MTKTQQIMALYDGVRTTREIAEIVGCRPGYVRVVARQRKGSGRSEIDLRYINSGLGQRTTAAHYPKRLAGMKAYNRAFSKALRQGLLSAEARVRAKAAYRKAYAEARNQSQP